MFEDMKKNIPDWTNGSQVADYLIRILEKKPLTGPLIYGIGHAFTPL